MKTMNRSLISLFILIVFLSFCQTSWATTYYVSTAGDDTWDGKSPATAWRTIDKLNNTNWQSGDVILFKRGEVFRGQINLRYFHNNLTFGAYDNGVAPVLSGSVLVTGWTPAGGGIYVADVNHSVKNLFVNGKQMTLARYPNSGFLYVDAANAKVSITDAELTQPAGYWNGANIRLRTLDYSYETRQITGYASGTLSFVDTKDATSKDRCYYLDNKREQLDQPGEWFYDEGAKKLYYYPIGGADPSGQTVEGAVYQYGINVDDNSKGMTMSGLRVQHQVKDGINLPGAADNNVIKNCQFYGQLNAGLNISGTNIIVEANQFEDINGRGIVSGLVSGIIKNNLIKNIGLVPGLGRGATGIDYENPNSDGTIVSYNVIENIGYIGLKFVTKNCIFEKNVIRNTLLNLSDGGAIYTCCTESSGNIVRNNMIYSPQGDHNGKPGGIAMGIYLDNYAHHNTVEGNTVANSRSGGILLNAAAHSNTATGNVVYNSSGSQLSLSDYLESLTYGNVITNNVLVGLKLQAYPLSLVSNYTDGDARMKTFGTYDNNYYFNPYTHHPIRRNNFSNYPVYTLSGWRNTGSGEGANSKESFLYLNSCEPSNPTAAATEIVNNGSFATNTSGWGVWGNTPTNTTLTYAPSGLDGGALHLSVSEMGGTSIGFAATNSFPLEANAWYRLKLSAKSSQNGDVQVLFKRASGNFGLLGYNWYFPLTPTKADYDITFQIPVAENPVQLIFQITDKEKEVWLDNVSLTKIDVTCSDPTQTVVLFTNDTDANKAVSLPGNCYVDLNNQPITSFSLLPFTSKVVVNNCDKNQLPTVALTAPAEGLNVVAGKNITLIATASDVDGHVAKVAFYQEGILLGESTTAPYNFTWSNPPAGSYQLKAIATDNKGAISVSNLIRVTVKAPTYTVIFTVKDAGNTSVSGASVTLNGQTLTSDANGVATFANVAPGNSIAYTVSKTSFSPASGSVSVVSSNVTQNIALTVNSIPAYTVTFTIKDGANVPVLGASVVFNRQTLASDANGKAIFNNVSLGNNLFYSISKNGFNPNTGVLSETSSDSDVTKDITLTALSSPTYTVSLTLKDGNNTPVSGASVTFNGRTLTSDANGVVTFTNVAPGSNLSYTVSKTGFNPASGSVSLTSSSVAQNLVLVASTGGEPTAEPPLAAQLNARNIFSPNGDGVNEIWEVEGIEQQPELQVLIFNVYGQKVYQAQPYTNSWDGAGLPEGVYYYQMQNQQGKPFKKGAITLVR